MWRLSGAGLFPGEEALDEGFGNPTVTLHSGCFFVKLLKVHCGKSSNYHVAILLRDPSCFYRQGQFRRCIQSQCYPINYRHPILQIMVHDRVVPAQLLLLAYHSSTRQAHISRSHPRTERCTDRYEVTLLELDDRHWCLCSQNEHHPQDTALGNMPRNRYSIAPAHLSQCAALATSREPACPTHLVAPALQRPVSLEICPIRLDDKLSPAPRKTQIHPPYVR